VALYIVADTTGRAFEPGSAAAVAAIDASEPADEIRERNRHNPCTSVTYTACALLGQPYGNYSALARESARTEGTIQLRD
jgi:hypothetical protein